ncbi:MAG: hypothetical protein LAN71_18035, partial [Acidobacteriia bacterium]|nr:hypothetical protein [Terriglobia bacterium]
IKIILYKRVTVFSLTNKYIVLYCVSNYLKGVFLGQTKVARTIYMKGEQLERSQSRKRQRAGGMPASSGRPAPSRSRL